MNALDATSTVGLAQFDVSANTSLVYIPGGPPISLGRNHSIALSDRSGKTTEAGRRASKVGQRRGCTGASRAKLQPSNVTGPPTAGTRMVRRLPCTARYAPRVSVASTHRVTCRWYF
jgi:hypothetical protein